MVSPTTNDTLQVVSQAQLASLDDSDCYATAWADALKNAKATGKLPSWGGRGKGGRGTARRTYQPYDVILSSVRLEYVNGGKATSSSDGTDPSLFSKLLLEDATLKLLAGHVYALIGRNACGKSTLLRRINACRIPGFPTHISSQYIPQEVIVDDPEHTSSRDVVLKSQSLGLDASQEASKRWILDLEKEMDELDMSAPNSESKMNEICEKIASIEESLESNSYNNGQKRLRAEEALAFFGIDQPLWDRTISEVSPGILKKCVLASVLCSDNNLLLLDEPTNFLDVEGLMQLRHLIEYCREKNVIVLLVSHDIDLINDVATDTMHFFNRQLYYYPGNYRDFQGYRMQDDLHRLRQNAALEKKREAAMKSIVSIRNQPTPRRGGARKKGKQLESKKKKLESLGIQKDENGHRWTAQKAGTGIRDGSINSVDSSSRKKLTHQQLLKRAETNVAPEPDKEIQFNFRNVSSIWGEPLITAMDVAHGFGSLDDNHGLLFDYVDMCIEEGSTTCILGENASGKTTLLRILAGLENPLRGKVHHAQNVNIEYFDQNSADKLVASDVESMMTPLSLLRKRYPSKTEQDCRGELTSFGLGPKQALSSIRFLSGGERVRFCLANIMLSDPHVLLMDEPSSHLDPESLEAFVFGLRKWNGTLVVVSHDTNLIRCLESVCFVIDVKSRKLFRVPGGIDGYLKALNV